MAKTQAELDASFLNAVSKHNFDKAKKLLKEGANILAQDAEGNTALHKLSERYPSEEYRGGLRDIPLITEFIGLLTARKFDLNARNKSGQTCLHRVASSREGERGAKDLMCVLIGFGASTEVRDNLGRTPLHGAALNGHAGLIDAYLLPLVAIADNEGKYPHELAMMGGHHVLSGKLKKALEASHSADKAPAVANEEKQTPPASTGLWLLSEPEEVAHVKANEALGYKITEIFNFHTRAYTQIVHNLQTKADIVIGKGFDDFSDKTILEDAYRELTRLDGKADEAAIYRQVLKKDKPKPT